MNDFETVRLAIKTCLDNYADHMLPEMELAGPALDRIEAALQDAETDLQMHEAEVDRLRSELNNAEAAWVAEKAEVERLRGENYALTMRIAALRAELKDSAALAKEPTPEQRLAAWEAAGRPYGY